MTFPTTMVDDKGVNRFGMEIDTDLIRAKKRDRNEKLISPSSWLLDIHLFIFWLTGLSLF